MLISAKIPTKYMMPVTADQDACMPAKINAINEQNISFGFHHMRKRPNIPKFRCISAKCTALARHILLSLFTEQPIQKYLQLLRRIVYFR
jgi:hypothetical protein